MNELEQWVIYCLECPPKRLKARNEYALTWPVERPHYAEPQWSLPVSNRLLLQLHRKFKQLPKYEAFVWDSVLARTSTVIPDEIAHYLTDHNICVGRLAHSCVSEAVSRRMIPFNSELRAIWANELYRDSRYSLEEFIALLQQYPNDYGLFERTSHSTAIPSKEKFVALWEAARRHPYWETLKRNFPEDSSAEEYFRRQEEASVRFEQLIARAQAATDPTEIRSLYAQGKEVVSDSVKRTLIDNPHTPLDVLSDFVKTSPFYEVNEFALKPRPPEILSVLLERGRAMLATGDNTLLHILIEHHNLPDSILEELAFGGGPGTRSLRQSARDTLQSRNYHYLPVPFRPRSRGCA